MHTSKFKNKQVIGRCLSLDKNRWKYKEWIPYSYYYNLYFEGIRFKHFKKNDNKI